MGKRKTLEKKIELSLKRQTSTVGAESQPSETAHAYTLPLTHSPSTKSTKLANQYTYVTHDLVKTVILSTSLVAFQITLFLLLKLHILLIPFITY